MRVVYVYPYISMWIKNEHINLSIIYLVVYLLDPKNMSLLTKMHVYLMNKER